MGHLINPVAFRLGWSRNWCDSWYSDAIYYPEFLHDIFRVRLFLQYSSIIFFPDNSGIFFNSFEFFFKYHSLMLRLFYYDAGFAAGIYRFCGNFYNFYLKRRFRKSEHFYNRRLRKPFYRSRFSLFFLTFIHSFFNFTTFFGKNYYGPFLFGRRNPLRSMNSFRRALRNFEYSRMRLVHPIWNKVLHYPPIEEYFKEEDLLIGYKRYLYYKEFYDTYYNFDEARAAREAAIASGEVAAKESFVRAVAEKVPSSVRRVRSLHRLYLYVLRLCSPGALAKFLRKVRRFVLKNSYISASFKFFFVFATLFQRIWSFRLMRSSPFSASKFSFLLDYYGIGSLYFFFGDFRLFMISSFIGLFAGILLPNFSLSVSSFLVTNDQLSADFIARFIGRKLMQGLGVREVVNPIMRDLVKGSRRASMFKYRRVISPHRRDAFWKHQSAVIKAYILKFFGIYKRLFFRFFSACQSWVSLYFYSFLTYFACKFSCNVPFLIGCARSFMLCRHSFMFFFNFDYSFFRRNMCYAFNDIFFDHGALNKDKTAVSAASFFFYLLYDDLYSNFTSLFLGQSFTWKGVGFSTMFVAAAFFFNRIVRFCFWGYKFSWFFSIMRLNKMRVRLSKRGFSRKILIGFKVRLRGRFSRKQIASSFNYRRGRVPLNTVSAAMDFGLATVPIKNSLVSIRIWLYKQHFRREWFFRQL